MNTNESISLFKDVERRATNISLNGTVHPFAWHKNIEGCLSEGQIEARRQQLKKLSVDDYVAEALDPAEAASRPSAKDAINKIRGKIHSEYELGPLYCVDLEIEHNNSSRRVGIIAQDRSVANGVWKPEHHLEACRIAKDFSLRSIPIVTFMDLSLIHI